MLSHHTNIHNIERKFEIISQLTRIKHVLTSKEEEERNRAAYDT